MDGHGLSIRPLRLATNRCAELAVLNLNSRTPPDAPQDISTGDRRGWRPSRRKPQDLVYFSIDYFVINASLPR